MTRFQAPFEESSVQGDVKGWGIYLGWLEVVLAPLWGTLQNLQGYCLHPCAVLRPIRPSETSVCDGKSVSLSGLQSSTACWYLDTMGVGSRPSPIYSVFSSTPPPLHLEIFQPKIKPHRQLHSATSFQKGRGKSRGWCPAALLASQQLQNFLLSCL